MSTLKEMSNEFHWLTDMEVGFHVIKMPNIFFYFKFYRFVVNYNKVRLQFHGSPRLLVSPTDSLYVLGLCDSQVLKDDKSSAKVADFNDPSMCVFMLPS